MKLELGRYFDSSFAGLLNPKAIVTTIRVKIVLKIPWNPD
jgi:hypothetical protein